MSATLEFKQLRDVNLARCRRWHNEGSWSLSDWAVATAGELGEALNVIKKLNRFRDGISGNSEERQKLERQLAEELADTAIYLDLLAARAGIDLDKAIVEKFNKKSVEVGFPERLGLIDWRSAMSDALIKALGPDGFRNLPSLWSGSASEYARRVVRGVLGT